ncbi:MAG: HAD family hydrolase [Candidatus Niyogibacteria bacterium]|nr:HAD family hydrolase [Candidatus Niyogibacteria bacterium]
MTVPKAVLLDVGNVLVTFDREMACKKLALLSAAAPEEIMQATFSDSSLDRRERGEVSAKEFFEEFRNRFSLNKKISFAAFRRLWGDIFRENHGIANTLEIIHEMDISMFLLSNIDEIQWEYVQRLPVIQKYFSNPERRILSFEVGARKPEEKIFLTAIARSGAHPSNILYIDDVRPYLDAFAAQGGKTCWYDCTQTGIEKCEDAIERF